MNKKSPQGLVFKGFRVILTLSTATSLVACANTSTPDTEAAKYFPTPDLVCQSPANYANKVVGDGHCVSLIKRCSGSPRTNSWRPGAPVLSSNIPPGTVIATFKNNRYPNRTGHHAAIYIKHDDQGIWVWDQWIGKPVHKRLIRIRNDNASPGNTAQAYRVVKIK